MESKKNFLINIAYYVTIGLIVYFTLTYVFPILMPFVIGFFIALILLPVVDGIASKFKIQRKLVSLLVLIIFYGTIGLALFYGILWVVIQIKDIFLALPDLYRNDIEPAIFVILGQIQDLVSQFNPELISSLEGIREDLISSLGSLVSSISASSLLLITGFAASIPGALITFLFTIISSFFITIDFHEITKFIGKQLPQKANELIVAVRDDLFGTLFKFAKAYAIIMFVTFIELSIGFTILKQPNAVGLAALIAMIDILPVLGTGGVVIPWIIIEVVNANYGFALGLFILYLVVTIIRNILEPKVVGDSIGLYPLITLMCMLVGAQLFGVVGLFGLPIAATILKNLNDKGKIRIFK